MTTKPTSENYYWLGKKFADLLDPYRTFEDISVELGVTKQKAHKDCMTALGKLVYRLRKNLEHLRDL
jgi:hypothetical protein